MYPGAHAFGHRHIFTLGLRQKTRTKYCHDHRAASCVIAVCTYACAAAPFFQCLGGVSRETNHTIDDRNETLDQMRALDQDNASENLREIVGRLASRVFQQKRRPTSINILSVYCPRSLRPPGYLARYSVTARSIVTKCAPPSRRFLTRFSSMMSRCPRPMT